MASGEQPTGENDEDDDQRHQLCRLVLRQPDHAAGIGADQENDGGGNDEGKPDKQHATLVPFAFVSID